MCVGIARDARGTGGALTRISHTRRKPVAPASRPGAPADRSSSVGWWNGCDADVPVRVRACPILFAPFAKGWDSMNPNQTAVRATRGPMRVKISQGMVPVARA